MIDVVYGACLGKVAPLTSPKTTPEIKPMSLLKYSTSILLLFAKLNVFYSFLYHI